MTKMITDYFSDFAPELLKIPSQMRKEIHELVFCHRQGRLSVVVGTRNFSVFAKIAKVVPKEIHENLNRYAVDLSSLYTNKLRLYWSDDDESVSVYGAYVDFSGQILEKKVYRKDGLSSLKIERTIGDEISDLDQGEVECDISEWTGPKEIVERAKLLNINMIALKKTHNDQTYLRIAKVL